MSIRMLGGGGKEEGRESLRKEGIVSVVDLEEMWGGVGEEKNEHEDGENIRRL